MAQTPPGTMAADAVAVSRVPAIDLRVAWGLDAADLLTDWDVQAQNETARVLDVSWSRQLDIDGPLTMGRAPAAEMSVTLSNYDQRFSPFNSTGALYSLLSANATLPDTSTIRYPRLYMTPVRLQCGFGANLLPAMYGYVDEPGENFGISGDKVTLRCLDRASALIQEKRSTALFEDQRTDDWLCYMVESLTSGVIRVDRSNVAKGLFMVPWAWLDDENVWSEVNKAAASEGGYAYFDESGSFFFRNATWWATAADSLTSVFTFTTNRFTDLKPRYDWKNVATGAVVEYESRVAGGEQIIWRSHDTIVIPPNGDTVEARFEYPCEQVYPPTLRTDWLPVNGGGMDMSENVGVEIDPAYSYAQRCRLTFTNTTHETAFVSDMKLRGRAVVGGPTEEIERRVAVPLVPENMIRVSGNAYIQQREQAQLIADLVGDRMQYPRLTYTISGVPAIPWLQLGDKITITAAEPITTSRTALVTKLAFNFRPEGMFTMDLDCIDSAGLYLYNDLFVIGTDELGGSARAFR